MLKKSLLLILSSIAINGVACAQIALNIKTNLTPKSTLPAGVGFFHRNNDDNICKSSKKNKHLFYEVLNSNVKVYYTNKGLCWHYITSKECNDSIEAHCINTEEFFEITWIDSDPNVQIVAEDSTVYGFKKITYNNLYKGIDAIFNASLSTTNNLNYSFFLHAGAALSSLKLKCKSGKDLHYDPRGRGMFIIDSKSAEFIGYQPKVLNKKTGYSEFCRYSLSNDAISFEMQCNSSTDYIINPEK